MKKVGELVKRKQTESYLKRSQGASRVQILKNNNEVSIYNDDLATPHDIAVGVARLKASFPNIEARFLEVLAERLQFNEFSANRLKEAIGNVIDTHKWKNSLTTQKASHSDFLQHWVENTLFLVKKVDCEMYGFVPNKKKK